MTTRVAISLATSPLPRFPSTLLADTDVASPVVLCSRFFSPSRQRELTEVKCSGRELKKGLGRERPRRGISGAPSLVLRCRFSRTATSEPFCVPNLDDAISALAARRSSTRRVGRAPPGGWKDEREDGGSSAAMEFGHSGAQTRYLDLQARFMCAPFFAFFFFVLTSTPSRQEKFKNGGRPSVASSYGPNNRSSVVLHTDQVGIPAALISNTIVSAYCAR